MRFCMGNNPRIGAVEEQSHSVLRFIAQVNKVSNLAKCLYNFSVRF